MVPFPEGPLVDAEAAFTGRLFPTDFICPPVAAGAVSSSLSDSSLLEESSPGFWVCLTMAGDDAQVGVLTVAAVRGDGVPTCTGGTLADVGVMGVPFLGEALI